VNYLIQESSEEEAKVSKQLGMNLTAVIELFPPINEKTSGFLSRISQILAVKSPEPVKNIFLSNFDTSIDTTSDMCPFNIDIYLCGLFKSHTPTHESVLPEIR